MIRRIIAALRALFTRRRQPLELPRIDTWWWVTEFSLGVCRELGMEVAGDSSVFGHIHGETEYPLSEFVWTVSATDTHVRAAVRAMLTAACPGPGRIWTRPLVGPGYVRDVPSLPRDKVCVVVAFAHERNGRPLHPDLDQPGEVA